MGVILAKDANDMPAANNGDVSIYPDLDNREINICMVI